MRFSHSRVECFENCPFKFKLHYIDELETLPNYDDADNPLIIGTALHHGLENDVETAIEEYFNSFPVITEKHEYEALKLEYLIPKGKELIPDNARFEVELSDGDNFIGYIDLLVDDCDGYYDIYDFKYSNHVDKYLKSRQLHLYKYFAEKCLGVKIRNLFYLMFPKIQIRQKKTEIEFQFKERLKNELERAEVMLVPVQYDASKVEEYFNYMKEIESTTTFTKNQTPLCNWCDYQKYCEEGDTTMLLPKCKRRNLEGSSKKVMWIYGQPFSGKTYLADKFPAPLMLNTDGNIKYVTAPYIPIHNEITPNGRVVNTKMAWEVFKDAIAELEKKDNEFKTIIVDLLEDTYEYCRLYMYKQMNITHESDDAFKAWDKVRTEFLSTIKRLMALDYDNIVLISHEDSTKDITKRSGDKLTSIKPNIPDKVANKIAGMVDIVVRCVVIDGERLLTFKTDEVVFGGGRLTLTVDEIPNTYDDLMAVYSAGVPEVKAEEKSSSANAEVKNAEEKVEKVEEQLEKTEELFEEKPVEVPEETTQGNSDVTSKVETPKTGRARRSRS